MVSVSYIETRSQESQYYRVATEVTTSSGIASEIFVKRESTYEFDRVATVADMQNLPTIPDPNEGYYRESSFYKDFIDVNSAANFSTGVKERINLLVGTYDDAVNNFLGVSTGSYHHP